MSEQKTREELAEEIKAAQSKIVKEEVDKVRGEFEDFIGKSAKDGKLSETIKGDIDQALTKLNATLDEKFADIDQQFAAGGGASDDEFKSFGDQFIEDERVKSFLSGDPSSGKIDMRFKAT